MAWHPFRNIGLKVVASVLAVLLWLSVGSDYQVERSVRVPLMFRNVPVSLELAPGAPDSVEVHVRGRSSLLTREQGALLMSVDLSDARAGSRVYHLRTDQVTAPFGVEVTQVFPASVMLTLEETGRRLVPVRATLDGEPAEGFVVKEVLVDPRDVEVVGPVRALKSLKQAITETVSIAGASDTVVRTVSIGVADASMRLREPRSAKVTVVIVKGEAAIDPQGGR